MFNFPTFKLTFSPKEEQIKSFQQIQKQQVNTYPTTPKNIIKPYRNLNKKKQINMK